MSADWVVIERDFRAGVLSVREIATAHEISHTAINKRAKNDGWERSLAAKIQAKAESIVAKQEAIKVNTQLAVGDKVTERQLIETNAEAVARVRLAHRRDISRAQKLVMQLFGELEAVSGDPKALETIAVALAEGDKDKMSRAVEVALSLGGRTKTLKDLADTLKTLVALEREAYSLAQAPEIPAGSQNIESYDLTDLARRMAFVFAGASHAAPRTVQ